jgi:hypothetical protein
MAKTLRRRLEGCESAEQDDVDAPHIPTPEAMTKCPELPATARYARNRRRPGPHRTDAMRRKVTSTEAPASRSAAAARVATNSAQLVGPELRCRAFTYLAGSDLMSVD